MRKAQASRQLTVPMGRAAEMLGLSVHTLRRWRAEGKLIAYRSPTGRWLVPLSEVKRLAVGEPWPAEAEGSR